MTPQMKTDKVKERQHVFRLIQANLLEEHENVFLRQELIEKRKQELEKIWYGPHWLYAGLECEIPEVGDFRTTTLGERPVIVVRSGPDEISLSNGFPGFINASLNGDFIDLRSDVPITVSGLGGDDRIEVSGTFQSLTDAIRHLPVAAQ